MEAEVRNPIIDVVTSTGFNDGSFNLVKHELGELNSANSSQTVPVTLPEVPRQIEGVTDPLTKQLGRLQDSKNQIRQAPLLRNEDASDVIQSSSKAPNKSFTQ